MQEYKLTKHIKCHEVNSMDEFQEVMVIDKTTWREYCEKEIRYTHSRTSSRMQHWFTRIYIQTQMDLLSETLTQTTTHECVS